MSEYQPGPTPSLRQRIFRLVESHSRETGLSSRRVWSYVYREFEKRTGKRWRSIAYNASQQVLSTIISEGKGVELLEFCRELIGTKVRG